MGQPEPDQGRLEVSLVTLSLACDGSDTGQLVWFASGEKPQMTGRLSRPGIQGEAGTEPDAAQFAQEEPDCDLSPPRQIVEAFDERGWICAAATDLTHIAVELVANRLGQTLKARGGLEVVTRIPAGVE